MPDTPYFTLPEARVLKPLDQTAAYSDADITATRLLVEETLEDACGVAFVPRTATEVVSGSGGLYVLPKWPRVTAVTAVAVDGTVYDAGQLAALIPTADGIYNVSAWAMGNANVSITYTHGYATVPLRVKRAALMLTKRWLVDGPFDDRATSMTTEDGTFSLVTPGVRGVLFDLPEVNAVVDQYGLHAGV